MVLIGLFVMLTGAYMMKGEKLSTKMFGFLIFAGGLVTFVTGLVQDL